MAGSEIGTEDFSVVPWHTEIEDLAFSRGFLCGKFGALHDIKTTQRAANAFPAHHEGQSGTLRLRTKAFRISSRPRLISQRYGAGLDCASHNQMVGRKDALPEMVPCETLQNTFAASCAILTT
jgi:hypothetical protein